MATTQPLFKSLRPASFRGVEFQVDDSAIEAGRRTQVHEYPQRDKPWAEDLGRATRGITLTAFVIGADYVERANKLLAALETAGPGQLVHPWLGTLNVSIKDPARVRFDRRGLGVATFDLSFVEAGELAFPTASTSTASTSRLAADGLGSAAKADFDSAYKTKGLPDFVGVAAKGNWQTTLGAVGQGLPGLEHLGLANRMADVASVAVNTASNPGDISSRVLFGLGLSGLASSVQRWDQIAQGLAKLSQHDKLAAPAPSVVVTPSRTQSTVNIGASNALLRQVLLAQAVGASSLADVGVYDDAIALRRALLAALDAELLLASDAAYAALNAARTAVYTDLTSRARSAARLRSFKPADTTPALALSYTLYGDASRADEVVSRNRVRHPGFVPPVNLQVLSS